jgi:hypothetical protein
VVPFEKNREQGSVVTEFLLTFPAFLVLCMFTLEASSMWMDRHIVRLASFEAARVMVAADKKIGGNPCEVQENRDEARSVAVRRIAAISPSVTYLLKALELNIGFNLSFPSVGNNKFLRSVKRLLLQLPSAAALTKLNCSYADDTVTVKIVYERMPKMPIIDKVMYAAYKLSLLASSQSEPVYFDGTFRDIAAGKPGYDSSSLKTKIIDSLGVAQTTGLGGNETAKLLSGINGFSMSTATSATRLGDSALTQAFAELPNKVEESAKTNLVSQEAILSAALYAIGLRLIPMTVSTTLQMSTVGPRISNPDAPREEPWQGTIRGVAKLFKGSWLQWAQQMSNSNEKYIEGGESI